MFPTPRRLMLAALTAAALAASACGSVDEAAPPTVPTTTSPPLVASTIADSTTTIGVPTTTTRTVPPVTGPELLVFGDDGVALLGGDGSVTPLLDVPVDFAVDDTRGGLVFQLDWDTADVGEQVWRVRPGRETAEQVLIATDLDVSLSLHDVVVDRDQTLLLYTKSEFGEAETDYRAMLKEYDLDTRTVRDVGVAGGYESAASPISFGGDLLVMNWGAEGFEWIEFITRDGIGWHVPGNPQPAETDVVDCVPCPRAAELSRDGKTLVYAEAFAPDVYSATSLVVLEMPFGEEKVRIDLSGDVVSSLDVADGYVVVNRLADDWLEWRAPLLVNLNGPAPTVSELPLVGRAHLVRAPLTLDGPVVLPPVEA